MRGRFPNVPQRHGLGHREGGANSDFDSHVQAYGIETGDIIPVATRCAGELTAAIDDGRVAFERRCVRHRVPSTESSGRVTRRPQDRQTCPGVSGDRIVCEDWSGGGVQVFLEEIER